MSPTPYQRGAAFEYLVMRRLRTAGWDVLRSAGSHDDPDLVAIGPRIPRLARVSYRPPSRKVFIQCKKRGSRDLSRKEMSDWRYRWKGRVEFYIARMHQRQIQVRDLFDWPRGWEALEAAL